jgi:organic hydroperoxide reductase OsmC/OhrA
MTPLPHRYRACAFGGNAGHVGVSTDGAPEIDTTAPPEFGGPPGHWSPETLLVAAIADCYLLSFRASARASRLDWLSVTVDVEGVLDKVDGVTRFTRCRLAPRLTIAPGASEVLARGVLVNAKRMCLITNSLQAECELVATVHAVANDESPVIA